MSLYDNINFDELSDVLSGAVAGRAGGRKSEAELAQSADRTNVSRYLAELAGYKTGLEAPGMNAGNAVRGDTLANAQDASVTGPITRTGGKMPTVSGGLRPSLMSADTRKLGQGMSRQALVNQMQGPGALTAPTLAPTTPLPESNAIDTILSAGGTASSLAAMLAKNPALLKQLFGGGAAGAETAAGTPPWEGPVEPTGGGGFPSVGAGGGRGSLSDLYWYLIGNPNAELIDPLLGGAMSGSGEQGWGGVGANPNVQAY